MTDITPPSTKSNGTTTPSQSPTLSPREDEVAATLTRLHSDLPPSPPALYLPMDQLEQLLHSVLLHHAPPKTKDDNPLNQARLEYFVSQGTKTKFDGDQDKLVPWIKCFRTLRTNAVWQSATYVQDDNKSYDLLTEFTKVTEAVIREQATFCWTSENQRKSMSQEHPTLYYLRILGKIIINSVTDEFYTILQNYAGLDLCNNGPLLLWLILSHFHTNTITYTERL
jgi:hypothetical protein